MIKKCTLVLICLYSWCVFCAFKPPFYYECGVIDGVDLTGKTVSEAEKILRDKYLLELKQKRLEIFVGEEKYVFLYPEINYSSNLCEVLKNAKNGTGNHTVKKRYYLCAKEQALEGICLNFYKRAQNASAIFTGDFNNPFTYLSGTGTRYIDFKKLQRDVENSLKNDFLPVKAKIITEEPNITINSLKKERVKLSEFTTYFNAENMPRVHNIELAANKINGCVLKPNKEFSFNETVGERTEKNGFKSARIIFEGDFIDGVGGGVCQASTTLYNAALLAGMQISEHHAHSLRVGYIEPSFDAMVSGYTADLKFINTTEHNVYIVCKTDVGCISIAFYGAENDITYARKSVILNEIKPQEQEEVFGDEDKVIKEEKFGCESEGYLIAFKNGKQISVKKLRKDKYFAVRGIVQKARGDT